MGKYNPDIYRLNAGLISDLAQVRKDLKRLALSASVYRNFMARSLGSMSIRAGLAYIGDTDSHNKAVHVPFVFSVSDMAIIELTDQKMRVLVDEEPIERVTVSTAITNGTFTSNVTGWTDADETGATSQWATGGYMSLAGTGYKKAIRTQEVTVAAADQGKEHALRITITNGWVYLRLGSTDKGTEYLSETRLGVGVHSIALTPTGNFHIYLAASTKYSTLIDSIAVESAGDMVLTTPWEEEDLGLIRYDQSADVIYKVCDGYHPYKIERRSTRSWSLVKYQPEDGPFRPENTDSSISISSSAIKGDVTLTSSSALFKSTHVGSLFRIASNGQYVQSTLSGADEFSNSVRVTGVAEGSGFSVRTIGINITGTWSGTITLQRSVDEDGAWEDVYTSDGSAIKWTSNTTDYAYDDNLSNSIIYYRLGFKADGYTSGSATVSINFSNGSIDGICRITAYTSPTQASASIIKDFGHTVSSTYWSEGQWSDYRGYPSVCRLAEGRLFTAGRDKLNGSVSDAYESYDDTIEGNSAPISRSIGSGPVDSIKWMLDLQRLAVGGEGAEHFFHSSSLDEPLTTETINHRSPTTQGSSDVDAVKLSSTAIYVQRSGTRLLASSYDSSTYQYGDDDLTKFYPEAGLPSIAKIAVQRQPDTRIHCLRSDGTAFVVVYSKIDELNCIIDLETDGVIEDVVVMPGALEDRVYYTVARTIGGTTKRYFEKFALEQECSQPSYIYNGASTTTISDLPYPNGTVVTVRDEDGVKIGNYTVTNYAITLSAAVTYADLRPSILKLADSFYEYSGASTATITGLDHLEGCEVIVFGDGKDLGTYTVVSGQITLTEAVEKAIIGLSYTARYKSVKVAYGADNGSAFSMIKSIYGFAPILLNTHAKGLKYGPDFDHLDEMPDIEDGEQVDGDYIWPTYEKTTFEFDDDFKEDPRICLEAQAPRPCTVMGLVMNMETFED